MPKYLGLSTYTPDGLKGLRAGGAVARVDALRAAVERVGGKLEALYYAFGEVDIYVIFDAPNDEAAAALSLAGGESGVVASGQLVKLLTPEQVDEAFKINVGYRPPGQ